MAEGPDVKEKPLEELEKEITCAVCHGHYQRAKLLPCNHYYCESCIDCPECPKAVVVPSGGVAGLHGWRGEDERFVRKNGEGGGGGVRAMRGGRKSRRVLSSMHGICM